MDAPSSQNWYPQPYLKPRWLLARAPKPAFTKSMLFPSPKWCPQASPKPSPNGSPQLSKSVPPAVAETSVAVGARSKAGPHQKHAFSIPQVVPQGIPIAISKWMPPAHYVHVGFCMLLCVRRVLHVEFCMSQCACRFLHVDMCMSLCACRFLHVAMCMSSSA